MVFKKLKCCYSLGDFRLSREMSNNKHFANSHKGEQTATSVTSSTLIKHKIKLKHSKEVIHCTLMYVLGFPAVQQRG